MNTELEFLATLFKVKRNFQQTQIERGKRHEIEFFKGKCEAYSEIILEIEKLQPQQREINDTPKPKRPFD